MNIQDLFPLGLTGFISCSPKDSQESSSTPQFKSINASADQDGRVVEGHALIFSCKSSKITTLSKQPSTGECWIPPRKDTPRPGQRRSPSKTVRGAKSHLESNSIPARDDRRVQTKPCVHQDPDTPQRLSQTSV